MERVVHALLCLACAVCAAVADKGCNKEECLGPLRFYNAMGCQPVYEKPDDCCAIRYDCSHLETRSSHSCYAAGRKYEIGEILDPEHTDCNYFCKCTSFRGKASWSCSYMRYDFPELSDGCYFAWNASTCQPGPPTCPASGDKVPECMVDGIKYMDGQEFTPKDEPRKRCWCGPGYKGENVAPFCKDLGKVDCRFETRNPDSLRDKCIPVYEFGGSTQLDCNTHWRCPYPKDKVLEETTSASPSSAQMMCKFGNVEMKIGEKLNRDVEFDSACVNCICQVPPIPTCQYFDPKACNKWRVPLLRFLFGGWKSLYA